MSNAASRTILSPKSNVASTLFSKTATMSKQHSTVSKGRNFTINSFDTVAVLGNKVEYCFDKVERSFNRVACCFNIVAGVDGTFVNAARGLNRDDIM